MSLIDASLRSAGLFAAAGDRARRRRDRRFYGMRVGFARLPAMGDFGARAALAGRSFPGGPGRAMMRRIMSQSLTVRSVEGLSDVPAAAWDACANPPGLSVEAADGERFNPFVTHAFLFALEQSRSVGGRSGWAPAHLLVEDAAGRLVAAAPTYLKGHSQGEYVFDHSWADAYQRAGGDYYPKLQVAVPFTPVTGRRMLIAADAPSGAREALVAGWRALRKAAGASSVHVTFPNRGDNDALQRAGFLSRTGEQFHFLNEGYQTFDDFLAALASRKRKAIKRERRSGMTSRSNGSPATISSPPTGTPSSPFTWRPARANGAAPI